MIDASHQELWHTITQEMEEVACSIANLESEIQKGNVDIFQGMQQKLRLQELLLDLANTRRELLWESAYP